MGQKRERRGGRTEQKMNKPRFGAKAETLRGLTETDWPIGRGEVQVQSVNVGERKRPRPTSPPHFVLFYFLALPSRSRRERGGRRGPAALISTPQPTEPTNQPTQAQAVLLCVCPSPRRHPSVCQSPSLSLREPTSPRALVSGSATMTAATSSSPTQVCFCGAAGERRGKSLTRWRCSGRICTDNE